MTTVINGVPRDDLDLIRAVLDGFKPCMARDDALRTVRRLLATAQPVIDGDNLIRFDFTNGDGLPDSKMMTHDEMRQRYSELRRILATAQPAADGERGEYGDAYQGAREDLAIWKRRALEAEAKVREQDRIIENLGNALNDENGPTFMGEPVMQARTAQPQQTVAVTDEVRRLREALEFYANGDHLLLADPDEWDTCSGEPVNWLHDEAGTASVEDGSVAKAALAAHKTGEEDNAN